MNPISVAHPIGDPASAVTAADDPIVVAGLRTAGVRVRICTVCGRLVYPAHSARANFRHATHQEAWVRISPVAG